MFLKIKKYIYTYIYIQNNFDISQHIRYIIIIICSLSVCVCARDCMIVCVGDDDELSLYNLI